jgi:hypothetical protein
MKTHKNICLMASLVALTSLNLYAGTVEVTPSSMGDWSFTTYSANDDQSVSVCSDPATCGSGSMVTGPAPAPYGTGSANLNVPSSNYNAISQFGGATLLGTTDYSGMALSDLNALSYYTYDTANNGQQFPYLEIGISYTGVAGDPTQTAGTDQLFFEPPYQQTSTGNSSLPNQATPVLDTWQLWNALEGGWWDNNNVAGGGTGVESLAYFETYYNNVTITADPTTGDTIAFAVGFGNQDSYNGYVDGFTLNDTTYDFDPNATATPEPGTFVLLGGALLAGAIYNRRRTRMAA